MNPPQRIVALGGPRSKWPTAVSRWATSGMVPAEMDHCLTGDELRAVIGSGMVPAVVLVDADAPGLDRDLVLLARGRGSAVVGVDDAVGAVDWDALGCDDVVAPLADPSVLVALMGRLARRNPPTPTSVARVTFRGALEVDLGRLVAVTGTGGTGASTVGMLVAQGLASSRASVGLVDGRRRATLAMYHDVGRLVPGIQELVESHAAGDCEPEAVRSMFRTTPRGYALLPGLRRPGDWTVMRPTNVDAAVVALLRSFDWVVVDVDADLDRESTTGSFDVEDRHSVSIACLRRATVVALVADADMHGLHQVVSLAHEALALGVPASRLLPVVNRAPRSPAVRARVVGDLADLIGHNDAAPGEAVPPPALVPFSRRICSAHQDVSPLPGALARALSGRVLSMAEGIRTDTTAPAPAPTVVERGLLAGHLSPTGRGA